MNGLAIVRCNEAIDKLEKRLAEPLLDDVPRDIQLQFKSYDQRALEVYREFRHELILERQE